MFCFFLFFSSLENNPQGGMENKTTGTSQFKSYYLKGLWGGWLWKYFPVFVNLVSFLFSKLSNWKCGKRNKISQSPAVYGTHVYPSSHSWSIAVINQKNHTSCVIYYSSRSAGGGLQELSYRHEPCINAFIYFLYWSLI